MKKVAFLLIFLPAFAFLLSCQQSVKTETKTTEGLSKDSLELATDAIKKYVDDNIHW